MVCLYFNRHAVSVRPSVCLRTTLRSAYDMSRPSVRLSVVCLSVTLLRPRQRLELFGNIFTPPNTSGVGQFVLKFWANIRRGSI